MAEVNRKVYVVDDDESIRKSLARALANHDFEVETFASAQDFLNGYVRGAPGCLVLDHGMPEITGLDLQERLAKTGHTIPIIFITGHGGIPESVRAIKAGAVDFLEKPFRQSVLVDRINTALAQDSAARQDADRYGEARTRLAELTEREREIAGIMVRQPSEASSKYVARALDISPRTVDHHRARILEKMAVKSVAELVDLSNKADLFPT